jgi:peptidoglycan hydrolase-like protein with peptidoglycan-binding domain
MTQEFIVFTDQPLVDPDRRSAPRYQCHPATLVRLDPGGKSQEAPAWAADLSEVGIGLNLPYPLEVGITIVLEFVGSKPTARVTLRARVVHVTNWFDGNWRIGCPFENRLSPETLEGLLE